MQSYEELELVGKGTYGKVYKVKCKTDQQLYVLKKMPYEGKSGSEAEASLRESRLLSLLRHPHIVPYKEFFKSSDGELCLVMAYCEGGDLFKYIRAVSKKILHRDVKTQNIFLSKGKVLLGDFGLAKQLQRTLEMARTPIGTPYYMAPEIYEEQPYSFKSDVWALGCVMYELLTGKPAFAADNLSRVVLRVIRGNYDPLPDRYSVALRDIVCSMLTKSVRKRPDSNDLLTHSSVLPYVQEYLNELGASNAAGWSTWRMALPTSVIAQAAAVVERAKAHQQKPVVSAASAPAAVPVINEDALSDSQLLEAFSLSSLLQDSLALGKHSEEELQEHHVLCHQVDNIKAQPRHSHHVHHHRRTSHAQAAEDGRVDSLQLGMGVQGPTAADQPLDVNMLANNLPAGGFGFHRPAHDGAFAFQDLNAALPPTPKLKPDEQGGVQDALGKRAAAVRQHLLDMLGPAAFTQAMTVVQEVCAQGKAGKGEAAEQQLAARLRGVLSADKLAGAVALVDELLFLEGVKSGKQKVAS